MTLTFFLMGFSGGDWNSSLSVGSVFVSVATGSNEVSVGDFIGTSSTSDMDSTLGSTGSFSGCCCCCCSVLIRRRYLRFCLTPSGVVLSVPPGDGADGDGYVMARDVCCWCCCWLSE